VLIPSPFAEHFGITVLANIFLSIIIPAYNEERRLPVAMQQAFDFLQTQPYSYEVLIVENGSMDRTYRVAQEFAIQHPEFRVLQSEGLILPSPHVKRAVRYATMSHFTVTWVADSST
jgi:glycosyltransferase involved in cell wall biosynthesis